jgi:hypothetical protein
MLDWKFLTDGSGKHGWTADSAVHCDDTPLKWDIVVNDAGLFVVGGSASDFTDRKEIFETLVATKAWCQRIEDTVVAECAKPEAFSLPAEAINTFYEIQRLNQQRIAADAKAEEDAKFLKAVFGVVDTSTAEEAKNAIASTAVAFEEHVQTTSIDANAAYTGCSTEQSKPATVKYADNYVTSTGSLMWYREADGSFAACSTVVKEKKPRLWQITMRKDGRFQLVPWPSFTLVPPEPFDSLAAAMAYCQERENLLKAETEKAITFDKCSPGVEAAAAKAINEFVKEATKDALPRPFIFVILRTGNPYFDGKAAALLHTDYDNRKHRVRVENGNITWVDLGCLAARNI